MALQVAWIAAARLFIGSVQVGFGGVDDVRQATTLLGRPDDCVQIGDRESDIDELFVSADALHTKFVVSTCVDRLAEDGEQT